MSSYSLGCCEFFRNFGITSFSIVTSEKVRSNPQALVEGRKLNLWFPRESTLHPLPLLPTHEINVAVFK